MTALPAALAHLAHYRQFLLFKLVTVAGELKPRKIPIHPYTLEAVSAHDPAAWVDAATACSLATLHGQPYGVAFSFQPGNDLFFIDIDNALQADGQWSPVAQQLCQRFAGAAVEVSLSGRGLHIIGRGTPPPHACKNIGLGLELYHEYRFVALTGLHATGEAGTDHTAALPSLVADYFPPRVGDGVPDAEWTSEPRADWRGPLDDESLLRRARQSKSVAATFGAVRATFDDLWTCNVDVLAQCYPDPVREFDASSADAALAAHLAFWTGCNCDRMLSLMHESELKRDKWEREDYLQRTILGAVARQGDVLKDKEPEPVAVADAQRYKLLSSDDLRNLPPLAWRVKGVLPAVGLAALYGPSASGKSFLAFDMAAAIAGGRSWFDCRVVAAPVVYAALEGESGFKLRAQALEKSQGRGLPDALRMMMQPFKLTDPRDVADLAAVVPAGAVVVLDTLNRAAPTADENSSKDMGEILEAAKTLQALTGGLVVLVHHTGKDTTKGLRGHSSLFAAMDAAVEVSRDEARREWKVAKSKDGQDGEAHPFKLQVEVLGDDEFGDPVTSCVVMRDGALHEVRSVKLPQGGNQKLVLDALRPLFEFGTTGKPGAPPLAPCVELEAAVIAGASKMTCPPERRATRTREAITGLVSRGVLKVNEGWLWKI